MSLWLLKVVYILSIQILGIYRVKTYKIKSFKNTQYTTLLLYFYIIELNICLIRLLKIIVIINKKCRLFKNCLFQIK